MKMWKYGEKDLDTPMWLYDWLDWQYKFDLDAAASRINNKHYRYISQDALYKEWKGTSVFIHIPQVRSIGDWVRKAWQESSSEKTVVMLLPVRTDTAWFHEYCTMADTLIYLRGRLEAIHKTEPIGICGFPHMVVVFGGEGHRVRYLNCGAIKEKYEDMKILKGYYKI